MEILVGGQDVATADVAHWLNADPRQEARLLKKLQKIYGIHPRMLDLTLFSGATMLAPLAGSILAARRKARGE